MTYTTGQYRNQLSYLFDEIWLINILKDYTGNAISMTLSVMYHKYRQMILPLITCVYGESYSVNWGDGIITRDNRKHTYKKMGIYKVSIMGNVIKLEHEVTKNNVFNNAIFILDPIIHTTLTTINKTFSDCPNINSDIILDMPNCHSMSSAFAMCPNIKKVSLNLQMCTQIDNIFAGCTSINNVTLNLPKCININFAFSGCTGLYRILLDLPMCTSAHSAFENSELTYIDMFNMPVLRTARKMFSNTKLISVEKLRLTNIQSMYNIEGIFTNCQYMKKIIIYVSETMVNIANKNNFNLKYSICYGCNVLEEFNAFLY